MAGRPYKQGLDYFFMDTTIEDDEKIQALEAVHPCNGFKIFVKLLCRIYKTHGYFIMFTPKQLKLYSNSINVDINSLNDVVNSCIEEQLFNKELFEKYKILTSKSIQSRFLQSTKRRDGPKIIKDFCLLSKEEVIKGNGKCQILIYDDINSIFVDNNIINEYLTYTLKVINVNFLYYTISINTDNIIYKVDNSNILEHNIINNNMASEKKIEIEIKNLGRVEVVFLDDGDIWRTKQYEDFFYNSQTAFENAINRYRILNSAEAFKKALEAFLYISQMSNEKQSGNKIRVHFGHWLNSLNGKLDQIINSQKHSNGTATSPTTKQFKPIVQTIPKGGRGKL